MKQIKYNDFWEELPQKIKESINKGIEQAKNRQLTPHKKVMKNIKSKYLQ